MMTFVVAGNLFLRTKIKIAFVPKVSMNWNQEQLEKLIADLNTRKNQYSSRSDTLQSIRLVVPQNGVRC